MLIREIELAAVCRKLPSIEVHKLENESDEIPDDIFICACGFEERSLTVPSWLDTCGEYRTMYSVVIEHETNHDDNEVNRRELMNHLKRITSREQKSISFKPSDFAAEFNDILQSLPLSNIPRVSLDISACSTQMIVSVLKFLFERELKLKLLYTEAETYHPTIEEYSADRENWIVDGKGVSKGILRASECRMYPGVKTGELPVLLIAFPTFKPERIKSIQMELQPVETWWIVGIPHDAKNDWRKQAQKELNGIGENEKVFEVSTFNYVDTLTALEKIYKEIEGNYHMVIASHGSKLQSVGVSLFCLFREDVGLWFSVPESFNPSQYTGGVKKIWQVDFGNTSELKQNIRMYGKLEVVVDR